MAENPKPLVSISCITYNHAPYIRECLEGFLMQKTNFPFEILIHDDASTDGTADIIREYQAKHPDLIKPILREKNLYSQGVRMMNRFNYERARGKYIALCEGDDFWTDPNKLQVQFDFMETNPDYSMCGCRTSHLNEIRKTYSLSPLSSWWEPKNQKLLDGLALWSRPFDTVTFFIRKSCYQEKHDLLMRDSINMPFGDVQLIFHMSHSGRIGIIDKDMATYRINKGSAMNYGERTSKILLTMFAGHIRVAQNNDKSNYVDNIVQAFVPQISQKKTPYRFFKKLLYLIGVQLLKHRKKYYAYKKTLCCSKNLFH